MASGTTKSNLKHLDYNITLNSDFFVGGKKRKAYPCGKQFMGFESVTSFRPGPIVNTDGGKLKAVMAGDDEV